MTGGKQSLKIPNKGVAEYLFFSIISVFVYFDNCGKNMDQICMKFKDLHNG